MERNSKGREKTWVPDAAFRCLLLLFPALVGLNFLDLLEDMFLSGLRKFGETYKTPDKDQSVKKSN